MTIIPTTVSKNPLENRVALICNRRVRSAVLMCNLKNDRMTLVHFLGRPYIITVIHVYVTNTNVEEAEVNWLYENLQDLLELKAKNKQTKKHRFIIDYWNTKLGIKEIL